MTRRDRAAARLAAVEVAIASHPLSSPPVRDAFEVIERHGKENSAEISRELSERDLPSLVELGRIQVRSTFSWWNLHRRQRALRKKLGRDSPTA